MGGVKKKTLSSSKTSGQQPGDSANKPKKDEGKSPLRIQKHKSSVLIEDNADVNLIRGMKVITASSLAKVLGVKISVANNYIHNLEAKGMAKHVGGYSGHKIYSLTKL